MARQNCERMSAYCTVQTLYWENGFSDSCWICSPALCCVIWVSKPAVLEPWVLPAGGRGHLYSKVDIMLEYKNMEKGWFFKERHVPGGALFKVSKAAKIMKKGMFFKLINKAVLEPWVSPAFAITYFCNHCNINFDPKPQLEPKVIDP